MKIKLCKRCGDSFDTRSGHHICQRCFSEVVQKYYVYGESPTPEQMDYIEEVDQISEFYLTDTNRES